MPATPTDRPPHDRVAATLAWGTAVAHPLLFLAGLRTGPYRPTELRFFLTAVAVGLTLPLVRRNPPAALGLLLAGMLAAATTRPDAVFLYLPVLAADAVVGRIALLYPLRILLPTALGALGAQIAAATYTTSGQDVFVSTVVALALALLTAGLLGRSVRERRSHAAELRVATAAEAVAAERLRIARELHDVVAHSIGVIAIQAGVGRRVIDTRPAEARNALATIETTGRETLAGLRRTLGALRGAAADGRPAPRDPAPGLADLERLAASTADAGVRVELRHLGNPDVSLPPEVDLAAYRIVQESLTNVVRHAAVPTCRVTVERRADTLLVEIADDGRGTPCAEPGGGYGLVGMRERAALLGGSLSAGPRPGGGFHVTALLPLPDLLEGTPAP
ncbi:two-component sensor histidine kinase [Streptomyces litmocidini]|uniref:sensor histidine kinase n=1 Tax=Streptomyces litmocidini TaxID=67318 RepID=UPI00167C55A2|nr:sensor histidine kinase [Streptomyces litmocidini]GGV15089.1 two-component sensor histidine kinase [Streptomyces litmocidini]